MHRTPSHGAPDVSEPPESGWDGSDPDPPGRATMREVAALAGVSIKTVSRVVNDESGVAPDVRHRVRQSLIRLDYRPNLSASALRRTGGRTALIGALLQDLGNSFSADVLRALEDTARANRMAVLAASLDEDPSREQAMVRNFVERRVEGLVLMPASDRQDYLAVELRAGLPAVFVDRRPSGVCADSVTVDNRHGARLATEHLLRHHHRRIALLTDLPEIQTARDRTAGHLAALRTSGAPDVGGTVVSGLRDADAAAAAVLLLLDGADPPTALFTGRNVISIGAIRALRSRGLHHAVALVGFDDIPVADLVDPPLTVVRQDVARIGELVSDLLFARLRDSAAPPCDIVLEPVLVPRGSGEIVAGAAGPALRLRSS